ncbi:GNAT family N-acetyltransferase [uncultured Maribacter sp.]|uniref:GNAT family N-acetyltransferase n=1 Tax=uncultured Maribacter sp. TaxID=431308 RepID=UPI002621E430|nr:GNAT family N-acetyltransferase [uncultured Maribacter sp.]
MSIISYNISTNKELLNVHFIHNYISAISYWGKGRTLEEVKSTIENSLCFGVYTDEKVQIGFARVVTDYTFFGYIMDVIIDEKYQRKGIGKRLISFILNNKIIKNLSTVALKTKDAQELYIKYGFKTIGDSPLWMSMDKQNLE